MNREMKGSGVEWIGDVPIGWVVPRLKYIIECLDGKRIPVSSELRQEGPYPYWGAGSITGYINDYIFDEELILLGEDGAPFFDKKRNVAFYVNEKIWVNNHIHVLKAKKEISPNYLTHFLNIVDYGSYINGSILNKLTQSNMRRINVAMPSVKKQIAIANYLDAKNTVINSIIEKTKSTIEDYKLLKQSIITEAVTKGLDKNVEMKDSGIEWIGEIPGHWRVTKLKYLFRIVKEISGEEGHNVLSVTQKGLKIKDVSINEGQMANNYSKYQFVRIGDFVMNHMDLLTGWVDISKFEGVTSPDYRVFYPQAGNEIFSDYYKMVFQTCYRNKIFYGLGQGVSSLGRWRLQSDKFLNFSLPEPPHDEQQKICSHLYSSLEEIELTVQKKEGLLADLEAYKKSLIYEYVTGKKEVT